MNRYIRGRFLLIEEELIEEELAEEVVEEESVLAEIQRMI